MPDPAPRRPRRRINPDKAPLDRLPLLKADSSSGPIRVIRGEFDPAELTDAQRDDVCSMHQDEFVVFTNSLGQHTLAWRNQLIDRDIDLTKMGTLPGHSESLDWPLSAPLTLESEARWLRGNADMLLDLAETYEALAADGWEVHHDPRLAPFGDIVQREVKRDTHGDTHGENNADPAPDDAP